MSEINNISGKASVGVGHRTRINVPLETLNKRIQELRSQNETIKNIAIEELASWREVAVPAIPLLIDIVGSQNESVQTRRLATYSLGEIGSNGDDVVNALQIALFDEEPLIQEDAAQALGKIGRRESSILNALKVAAKSANNFVQRAAQVALEKIQISTT